MGPAAEERNTIVVGGGLVGLAVAYGLLRCGRPVTLLAEGDAARPASLGNFGLVWLQSKGEGMPAYTAWTARSIALWPGFAADLAALSGIDVRYAPVGGLHLCLGEAELERRAAFVARMGNQMGAAGAGVRMLDRAETRALAPGIGPAVSGASWCALDGHADPLRLGRALLGAALAQGLEHRPSHRVRAIRRLEGGYALETEAGPTLRAPRVVLAAGLGNAALAQGLGRSLPLRPQRGQILVTRRLPRLLDLPTAQIRQTAEGTVMLGDSKEEVGPDHAVTARIGGAIAARAIASLPALADAQVVRSWGALRVMSPDGFPLYHRWPELPGLWALGCHSGVTLAAVHAGVLAPALARDMLPPECAEFSGDRFDVQRAQAV